MMSGERGLNAYLMLTALLSGGLVMVIEVLGSRVIGPFFGVGLFVWTSLIAVTLIGLAAGYAVGGHLADRHPEPTRLYLLLMLAGVLTLLVPWLKAPVLTLSIELGLRAGTFVSATLLFGPPLFLLGCVSPYLVRVATRGMHNLGRTVGGLYALSTLGSVAGTALTGFVLIAHFGVSAIFLLVGALLILLGAGYFVLFRGRYAALLLLAMPAGLAVWQQASPVRAVMADGTVAELVAERESAYGSLKVVEYRHGARHTREMIIDGLVQGGIDLTDGRAIYEYFYFLQYLSRALQPTGERALVIGLGTGILPRWFEDQGIVTDVVDIDAAVVDLAREYFRYTPRGTVHVADARQFLARPGERYDHVILDVFSGDTTPGHLLSLEAVQQLAGRLRPGGVLGLNLMGSLAGQNRMTASVLATLARAFDQVEVYPTHDQAVTAGGNYVVMAYQGPRRSLDGVLWPLDEVHPLAVEQVARHLGRAVPRPQRADAIVLTDDYNPLDVLDTWIKEEVRRGILATTDWALLLR